MARAKYQFLPDLSEDDIRLLDRVSDWIMAADEKYITKFLRFSMKGSVCCAKNSCVCEI